MKLLGKDFRWYVGDPIRDAERSKFGKATIVEDQDEVTLLISYPLDRVSVAAGKIPNVTGPKVLYLPAQFRIKDGYTAMTLDHISPFGGICMPV
jgi:hypothetical protein